MIYSFPDKSLHCGPLAEQADNGVCCYQTSQLLWRFGPILILLCCYWPAREPACLSIIGSLRCCCPDPMKCNSSINLKVLTVLTDCLPGARAWTEEVGSLTGGCRVGYSQSWETANCTQSFCHRQERKLWRR